MLKDPLNVPKEAGKVMQARREVVGRLDCLLPKKRYAIQCLDIEG